LTASRYILTNKNLKLLNRNNIRQSVGPIGALIYEATLCSVSKLNPFLTYISRSRSFEKDYFKEKKEEYSSQRPLLGEVKKESWLSKSKKRGLEAQGSRG